MRNSIKFLIFSSFVMFSILSFIDLHVIFTALICIFWLWVSSIQYAIITREEIGCSCFEERTEEAEGE